uniref:Envelope membrane protein n=1 Tax=Caulerpa verticillata TaxID=177082 RepID=A0A386B073_9CHLO|nr:Envelope membrane protein [Caulerpa verticillata]AYC65091.1 Envelope membrane protein [Caulerpa verticillata]
MNEQIGWIPRSIIRTFQRFFKQIGFQTDLFAIYEFRVSRYFAIASVQCILFLILCPWIFQFLIKMLVFKWLKGSSLIWLPVFLNFHQQEQALEQLHHLDAQIYFDTLLNFSENSNSASINQTAEFFSNQSLHIITNWISDVTTLIFFLFLLLFSKPQIIIFKTFFIESVFSLSETTKCFFLIFLLDLLVGFHSSKSWQVFLQFVIDHFGFQINPNFVYFFISTFPVMLDTIFKYWIFRYLNKISPSTVATYQAMIE